VTSYRRHRDAASTELGDEAVVLQLGTKRYYTLNATAARAWRDLEQCVTQERLEQALVGDFAIETVEVRPHVAALLEHLLRSKLIEPCASDESSSS
jgi:hypothetical protein